MALFSSSAAVRWPGFRHVVFDCDSTLAGIEGIDELAETPGLRAEIEELTRRAMDGERDLQDVYADRLALLQPDDQRVAALRSQYKQAVVSDAVDLIAFLQTAGHEVYVVSGGIELPVREFAAYLGVPADHVAAVPIEHDPLSGSWWASEERNARTYQRFADSTLTASDGKTNAVNDLTSGVTEGFSWWATARAMRESSRTCLSRLRGLWIARR